MELQKSFARLGKNLDFCVVFRAWGISIIKWFFYLINKLEIVPRLPLFQATVSEILSKFDDARFAMASLKLCLIKNELDINVYKFENCGQI